MGFSFALSDTHITHEYPLDNENAVVNLPTKLHYSHSHMHKLDEKLQVF